MRMIQAHTSEAVLSVLFGTVAFSGCGGTERGPILAGGREVKSWVADLHNPKPKVRRQAVLKLGNVGDEDPSVADALADALQDTDPLVRSDAILAVVKLKQPGAAIKERLEIMSKSDQNARARDLAGKALERLGKTE